jgi:XTP/dITP diphosphohydrolase
VIRAKLLIATSNPGKCREAASILTGLDIELLTLDAFPGLPNPVEDAETFEGNARKKALYYAEQTQLWSMADDSGLEVDALGGAPGIQSARYAQCEPQVRCGAEAKQLSDRRELDRSNNVKLIAALQGVSPEHRTARFRCVVALARPGDVLATACGSFEGRIVDDPRGSNGFGYDPHFFVPEHSMTAAQLPPSLKNAISHRAKALAAIRPAMIELLGTQIG